MPWSNFPPGWLATILEVLRTSPFGHGIQTFLGAFITVGVGLMAKIADEVKRGDRERFFSKRLFLDLPALVMMSLVSIGVSAYLSLSGPVAAALGAAMGYVGPRVVDAWLHAHTRK